MAADLSRAPHDAVRTRVRVAADKKPPRLPTREEIAALALDVYRLALDNVRTYTNKKGHDGSYPQPDFAAACTALKVASEVSGYGAKRGAPRDVIAEDEAVSAEEALGQLEKMRANIVKAAVAPLPKVEVEK